MDSISKLWIDRLQELQGKCRLICNQSNVSYPMRQQCGPQFIKMRTEDEDLHCVNFTGWNSCSTAFFGPFKLKAA